MSDLTTTPSPTTSRNPWLRTTERWMVTFIGFPLGGLVAELVAGPVDSSRAALVGGLITGLFVGLAQWWGIGRGGPAVRQWIAATAIALMVGLGVGATAVGFSTSLRALVIQGAICGLAVGAAQAFVLRARLGRPALAWPPALAAIWAIGWAPPSAVWLSVPPRRSCSERDSGGSASSGPPALAVIWAIGWAVTTLFGVQVDQQFTVFGSSGALVVTALTAVLPLMINCREESAS